MSNLGINRAYIAGEIEKTPQEKQKELDEKMKEFLDKGGKIEKIPDGMTGEQYREEKGIKLNKNKYKKRPHKVR